MFRLIAIVVLAAVVSHEVHTLAEVAEHHEDSAPRVELVHRPEEE